MADIITQIQETLVNRLVETAYGIPELILGLLIAAAIIAAGWIIGKFLGGIIAKILNTAQLDTWAKQHKLKEAVGGIELSDVAGAFVKWYTILIFLTAAVDVLENLVKINAINQFMTALVYYIPIVLASLIILVLGLLVAKFVRNKIEATQHKYKKTAARIAEIIIIYMAVVIGLKTVGIDVSILEYAFLIAFTAFAVVVALVLGISFGMAFKKDAKQLVNDLKREYT